MKLSDLNGGETIFIDANIFLYHFAGASVDCKDFLKRCESKEIFGVTGVSILAEVCHRLMIAEAIRQKLIRPERPPQHLQERPDIIKRLSEYSAQLINIQDWGIQIVDLSQDALLKSQIFRSQYGLLTNGSFIPFYMKRANTNKLATNDRAFSKIPSIEVYYPSDIE